MVHVDFYSVKFYIVKLQHQVLTENVPLSKSHLTIYKITTPNINRKCIP